MANYLPVLLVSVTAGMPDDAALQPLPRGQVDYLSHDWAEEDVWRSWRNMTKQKHEIANGVRLENASWRTWMKQRNKLKTVSPETLNWLKDSDVTWLYGPLHTAVDWSPAPKPAISPPAAPKARDDSSASSGKNATSNSLSSPSSTTHLDRLNQQSSHYPLQSHEGGAKKPILKHRSIAEMLTSALPPAPLWAEEANEFADEYSRHEAKDGAENHSHQERRESAPSGRGGRPPLFHTKSDTNILTRFGRGGAPKKARISPPRADGAVVDHDSEATPQAYTGSLSANQRTGASNNLADLMLNARNTTSAPSHATDLQSNPPAYRSAASLESGESSSANEAASSGWADSDGNAASPTASSAPQKKHISFNAIVEQCIAIDNETTSMSPSTRGQSWTAYDDDGYTEDTEDGLYEDVAADMEGNSESEDDSQVEAEEDEILEIKPSSRRSSFTGHQDCRAAVETHHQPQVQKPSPQYPERPRFRRSSTESSKHTRSYRSGSGASGSGSGSNSARSSEMGHRSSSVALDREHVTIAPIAPTILKTGGVEDNEDGILYVGGVPYSSHSANHGIVYGNGASPIHRDSSSGGLYGAPTGYGYGYGGYGYGECVSVGRNYAFEHFERGTEAGELVYQSPNGNVYPWVEGDAVRFRMQSEHGYTGSPPRVHGSPSHPRSPSYRNSTLGHFQTSSETSSAHFATGLLVREPSSEGLEDEAEFDYFDTAEGTYEGATGRTDRIHAMNQRQSRSPVGPQESETRIRLEGGEDNVRTSPPYINAGADSADRLSPQYLDSSLPRERTPSPDLQPKVNPRIASLKYESGCRSPSPSSSVSDIGGTLVPSSPTLAIPTPRISPAHQEDYAHMRSPPDSPIMHAGLLSPDMSPRGRSVCISPVSGSATSSSVVRSGSRSGSESRSESRGRSRTRNSSLASSPDAGEPERGRSRSRSTASGAHSPLGDSNSPQTRYPPLAIGGVVGLGIGGGFGMPHSGREVRDGRGTRLYRKTSEDFLGRHVAHSSRGRNREGKRISESLSPPFLSHAATGRHSAVSPPGVVSGSTPTLEHKVHSPSTPEGTNSTDSSPRHSSDHTSLLFNMPTAKSPEIASAVRSSYFTSGSSGDSAHSESGMNALNLPSARSGTSTMSGGRLLPPSIPEEDEQQLRRTPDNERLPPNTAPSLNPVTACTTPRINVESKPVGVSIERAPSQLECGYTRTTSMSNNSDDGAGKKIANRTAELMSSARTLFGTIWNTSS